jgi:hypothetical protein
MDASTMVELADNPYNAPVASRAQRIDLDRAAA